MSVFHDQRRFMRACGQLTPVHQPDREQTSLYLRLMVEELAETLVAANPAAAAQINQLMQEVTPLAVMAPDADLVELADGLMDVTVTTAGAAASAAIPADACWSAVFRSNMAKVDPVTGKVRRRDDGKVLKPEGWQAPDLRLVLRGYGMVV